MGRTNPTLRDRLDGVEREWQPFRRSLRRKDQADFDRLFDKARGHADAASQQNPPDAWRAFVMCVLLAQERELRQIAENGAGSGGSADDADSTGSNTGA